MPDPRSPEAHQATHFGLACHTAAPAVGEVGVVFDAKGMLGVGICSWEDAHYAFDNCEIEAGVEPGELRGYFRHGTLFAGGDWRV